MDGSPDRATPTDSARRTFTCNGNKVRAYLLKRQWDQALFGADVGDASRMAYWAALPHEQPLPDAAFDEIGVPAPATET